MLMQIWTGFTLHQEAQPQSFAKNPRYQHFPSLNGKLITRADSVLSVSFFLGPHSDSILKNSSRSFGRTGWNLQCFLKVLKTQHIWFFKRYKPAALVLHSDQTDFKLLLCGPWDVDANELLQKLALNKNYKNGQCSCNKTHQILINCRSLQSMDINERMPFQMFIIWVKFLPSLSRTQIFTQLSSYQWILLLVFILIIAKLTYEKVNIIRVNLNNISHPWKEIKWGSWKPGSFQVSATRIIIEFTPLRSSWRT